MNSELEELNKQFNESIEDLDPTCLESDLLYIFKKYVDDRFDLIDRKISMLQDHVFGDDDE